MHVLLIAWNAYQIIYVFNARMDIIYFQAQSQVWEFIAKKIEHQRKIIANYINNEIAFANIALKIIG